MSAATADPALTEIARPVKGGKKKLILIGAVVLLALLLAAAAGMLYLRNKAAHANADETDADAVAVAHPSAKNDPAHPPTFLPLEPFVVNLADRDVDRYAQVGVVLEVDSALFADQMKAYMPAIRNAILMILAQKNSRELLERAGKEQLADEIMRATVRPMGIEVAAPEAIEPQAEDANGNAVVAAAPPKPKSKAAGRNGPHNPVRHVHFSNFIIQ